MRDEPKAHETCTVECTFSKLYFQLSWTQITCSSIVFVYRCTVLFLVLLSCQPINKCETSCKRCRGSYRGVSGTVHGPKKQRITNHGYQNFIFPNHENQHVKHCFILFLRTEKCPRSVWKYSKIEKRKRKTANSKLQTFKFIILDRRL